MGIDYLANPDLVLGVMTQMDWMDEENDTDNYTVSGLGWMAGPYVVARLHDNLIFDGRAAWGQSTNDIDPLGTYEDTFDTERWLIRGQLTGSFALGPVTISPHINAIYFEEEQQSYTDSLGNIIPDNSISLGRASAGPTISVSHVFEDGSRLIPKLGIDAVWDFDPAELVNIDTGVESSSSDDIRARLNFGLTYSRPNSLSLNLTGFYDGIGNDDLQIYGITGRIVLPLH